MGNRIIAVVPARGGSVGVPGKNLRSVAGVALVNRAVRHAKALGQDVVLTTDSSDVAAKALSFWGIKDVNFGQIPPGHMQEVGDRLFIHHRPAKHSTSEARIGDALENLRRSFRKEGSDYDMWVLLQPTTPFRSLDEINQIRCSALEMPKNGSLVSVRRVLDEHPARMYSFDEKDMLSPLGLFPGREAENRQTLPPVYLRDGGFYLIGDELVASARQFSNSPTGFERYFPWTVNIDSEIDFRIATSVASEVHEGIK